MFYRMYLSSLCQRRQWSDPVYEPYHTRSGYFCKAIVNNREYVTDHPYETEELARDAAAMNAFMICRSFSSNDGYYPGQRPGQRSANGVAQGVPVPIGSGRKVKVNRISASSYDSNASDESTTSGETSPTKSEEDVFEDQMRQAAGGAFENQLRQATPHMPKPVARQRNDVEHQYIYRIALPVARSQLPAKTQLTATNSQPVPKCMALSSNGSECPRVPTHHSYKNCSKHHGEKQGLHKRYKARQASYEAIHTDDNTTATDDLRRKLEFGREVLELRDETNRRFYNTEATNRGHIRWILKLKHELQTLENKIKTAEPTLEAREEAPSVYRSLLDPKVPESELAHLPQDSPVRVLRTERKKFRDAMISRIYELYPSLNDSQNTVADPDTGSKRQPGTGDFVIRYVFREYLLFRADSDVLYLASKVNGIDEFLRDYSCGDLHEYIKFWERRGEKDTLWLLRDAICDYLLPPDASSILGKPVATDDEQRTMTREAWDILWVCFSDLCHWSSFELFCGNFADCCLVKKLIALGRFGQGEQGLLNAGDDISQKCQLAVLQGFIAIAKRQSDPGEPTILILDEVKHDIQARCYVVGRMAKDLPLADKLIQALLRRVARYIVVVCNGTKPYSFQSSEPVHANAPEEDAWVRKIRPVSDRTEGDTAEWKIDWTIEGIRSDMRTITNIRDRNMRYDWFEIIIIDRTPNRPFTLLDEVARLLLELSGSSFEEIVNSIVTEHYPEDEQQQVLSAITFPDRGSVLTVSALHYEGSRIRAWDDANDTRLRRIVDNMEANGIVSAITEFEQPQARPVVLPGADGLADLYFDYDHGPIDQAALQRSVVMAADVPQSSHALLDFAIRQHAKAPNCIFTRGRIHLHYCAWPMPALPRHDLLPNFCTVVGRMYRWKYLPFDWPLVSHCWQYMLHNEMGRRFPFVCFFRTTFVMYAADVVEAERNTAAMLEVAKKHGWKLSIPPPESWTSDISELGLDRLWEGIMPR
ncbi:uncharacterized protein LTR77_001079 [Saxophila tyrrhenica]|uniref:Uncharacterized protein n=1 Tax=Saxophila tyrrhenica TaxID=1690608 RepID=A0AAV9PJU0_9PEZI|nr:hypothetical protein LTR77_001079 [Saxophila tyrrhenica]